jgi:electron transport complex protein RnfG
MKSLGKLVGVLTLICIIAGLLLALVNQLTAGPISEAARKSKMDALGKVLPACDNDPGADVCTVTNANGEWRFYVARKDGAYAGAAFETTSREGYGGDIVVMVGVSGQGAVNGIEILSQKETPGLGAKIESPSFKGQFAGLPIEETRWAVKKDGGTIDQITAATISSRAVVDAIQTGLDVYREHRNTIQATGQE